ncbi:MAG: segregation/condensation protein A [Cyanobacteria bacterium QS_4_48_99]|nr:MAG: segregation/condensation protein A [Cyanobacteria bacterium QS_4_48_99]
MTIQAAQAAITKLIDLAQCGEIDPWDVQVIAVIDRFLSEPGITGQTASESQETDLPQSGQAFLWASMLVSLKADTLERLEAQQEESAEPVAESEAEEQEAALPELPTRLERHLHRRPSAPPPRKRRVTLQELISQIQQIAEEIEEAPTRDHSPRRSSQPHREATQTITQLAHNENLTEVATQLEQFLSFLLPQLALEQDWLHLEQLLDWCCDSNQPDENVASPLPSRDQVGVFWALLLLSSQSKVELSQEKFYQDLKIRPLNEKLGNS